MDASNHTELIVAGLLWPSSRSSWARDDRSAAYQRLVREVLEAQRGEIVRLRNQGYINDEVMRRVERDLDLEDSRLEI